MMENYAQEELEGVEGQNPEQTLVDETHRLWRLYRDKRQSWARHVQEDREFRLGRQWSDEQIQTLKKRGQAPIVINRIHPAVETAKALITANRPSFRCAPREDSDNKIAQVMSAMLSYMYDTSDGRTAVRKIVDDYYVCGAGFALVYQDPMMDKGKGEVVFVDVDPLDVYIDPNSRSRFLDDAENVIISRMYTKDQAKKMAPMYEKAISNANSDMDHDRVSTGREDDSEGAIRFPGEITTEQDDEYIRGYERYYKMREDVYYVHETFRKHNAEKEVALGEWEQYLQTPCGIYNPPYGDLKIITDEQEIQKADWELEHAKVTTLEAAQKAINEDIELMRAELEVQFQEKMTEMAEQVNLGDMLETRYNLEITKMRDQIEDQVQQAYDEALEQAGYAMDIPGVQRATFGQLIEMGFIKVTEASVEKICQVVVMGDQLLFKRVLPTDKYPLIAFMNLHTRTPYPMSDVRMVKNLQEYINKTRSLIVAHATTSTNVKILIPEGSVDMKTFEEKWAQPGVAIPIDFDMGQPVPVQPVALPNELYQNEQTAKSDIDHALGLYELMMGNSQAAPQTYKATISLDEFGQRKIKSKLADIEAGLIRLGQVAIPLMQQLYQTEKVFRIVQPNNSMSEYMVNKRMVDDKTGEVTIFNDLTIGDYDVQVVSGSTLPSNRYAELEFYMEAFKNGIVDRQEVLKKTEIFDMEGVMQRTDLIGQLEQQLEAASEEIKKLKGDLQTRDRESVNLRKKVEVEKFKGTLDKIENKASAAGTVFDKRLDDTLAMAQKEVRDAAKAGTPSKDAPKKKKESK